MKQELQLQPLSQELFAPFGQVIETRSDDKAEDDRKPMNDARFLRFDNLATTDVAPGCHAIISIAQCLQATQLPYPITLLERHPLGSQAFIPLQQQQMIIVVAEPTSNGEPGELMGFVSNGQQSIQYHRGTWHMPLIAFQPGATFLIVDSDDSQPNCDEFSLSEAVYIPASALPGQFQAVNKP
ncbi:MAG: ureidoglycolate lyase [Pseudomonadales bacterium]|nr:ureidoglycolate lyase [Pseudomonadales bacterium]